VRVQERMPSCTDFYVTVILDEPKFMAE